MKFLVVREDDSNKVTVKFEAFNREEFNIKADFYNCVTKTHHAEVYIKIGDLLKFGSGFEFDGRVDVNKIIELLK